MFIVERLISTVAPFYCLGCQQEGRIVCRWCFPGFCSKLPSRCYRCRAVTEDFAVCKKCQPRTPLKHVWVRTDLANGAEELLHRFKFERAQAIAPTITEFMGEAMPFFDITPTVIPIPSATGRIRQRGYDHAALLGRALAQSKKYEYTHVLGRKGQTRQVGAKRVQRLVQLKGAFHLKRPEYIKNRQILLIDDVVTTGATLEEAARVLRKAGAKRVDALVFAQKS